MFSVETEFTGGVDIQRPCISKVCFNAFHNDIRCELFALEGLAGISIFISWWISKCVFGFAFVCWRVFLGLVVEFHVLLLLKCKGDQRVVVEYL